ncbi:MAG: hypothetical protein M3Q22_14305, partial [Actinomycetota bacterium]|nr:hypothetical protein [Actinomycetota bacterium]
AGKPINTQADAEAADSGTYMPHGKELSAERDRDGHRKVHDLTPRAPDGAPIEPPVIPPDGSVTDVTTTATVTESRGPSPAAHRAGDRRGGLPLLRRCLALDSARGGDAR